MRRLSNLTVRLLMLAGAICFVAYLGYWMIIPVLVLVMLIQSGLEWATRDVHIVFSSRVTFVIGFVYGAITFGLIVFAVWGKEIMAYWNS